MNYKTTQSYDQTRVTTFTQKVRLPNEKSKNDSLPQIKISTTKSKQTHKNQRSKIQKERKLYQDEIEEGILINFNKLRIPSLKFIIDSI